MDASAIACWLLTVCHRNNGPGKNAILGEKIVRPNHSWLTKNGLAGPILVTTSGPA